MSPSKSMRSRQVPAGSRRQQRRQQAKLVRRRSFLRSLLPCGVAAGVALVLSSNAWAQVTVDNSGVDGTTGTFISPVGGNGTNGSTATVLNSSDFFVAPGPVLTGRSNGGDGGAGFDAGGIVADGGTGGVGGKGGTVNINYSGILSVGNSLGHAILAESFGGDGGNGGDAFGAFTDGGDGGRGGAGGSITIDHTGAIVTGGDNAQGIFARSLGGVGGSGGTGAGLVGVGGAAAGASPGGDIWITNNGSVRTNNVGSNAIFAQSVGGFGGSGGGAGGLLAFGASGESAGDGGNVTISNLNVINTVMNDSNGLFAQSIGGGGGYGGSTGGILSLGGAGNAGGSGGTVTIDNSIGGSVQTVGHRSAAIRAQSIGGGGGDGGNAVAIGPFVSVGVGGSGGTGGNGGMVIVDPVLISGTDLITFGDYSYGIQAQSIGGGGGNGGGSVSVAVGSLSASISVGGTAGLGGEGNDVTANHVGTISTRGDSATGVLAQSIGGGGGTGGYAVSVGGSATASIAVAIGGSGALGGNGGEVSTSTVSDISTEGDFASAVKAQSIGVGGGDGGNAVSVTGSGKFSGSLALGGAGLLGGSADRVTVSTDGDLSTQGDFASGIVAQSVGGGGGSGGFAVSGAFTPGPAGVGVALGGGGALGNVSSAVSVTSNGSIDTNGENSSGILAQSIGGGGGSGGMAGALAASLDKAAIGIGVGGASALGGNASTVDVMNSSMITTSDELSSGIVAQSIGGGGGHGGTSLAGGGGRLSAGVAVGGVGGSGGDAAQVTINNSSSVSTLGQLSNGIMGQSVGGGGGNGGLAIGAGMSIGAGSSGAAVSVAVGRSGGSGGAGGQVEIINEGAVTTSNEDSHAIIGQSIGGGGGTGGVAGGISGSFGSDVAIGIGVGGSGGSGATASSVRVESSMGAIETKDAGSNGIFAQSVGGGGGDGGAGLSAALGTGDRSLNLSVGVGGSGAMGGTADIVTVENSSAITVRAGSSQAILAQSIGGGGGTAGMSGTLTGSSATSSKQLGVSVGGVGGTGNDASTVTVLNEGTLTAEGSDDSSGILAQSIGGGGGKGGLSFSGSLSKNDTANIGVSIGGSGGVGGNAGDVVVDNSMDGSIGTAGEFSPGIHAQSIGGGGGTGGMGIASMLGIQGQGTNVNLSVSVGGTGGASGTGARVDVDNDGTITTDGLASSGISAQSIGGGGGMGGSSFTGVVGVTTGGATNASRTVNLNANIGGAGGAGNHGDVVDVVNQGMITTNGEGADGILAQSIGGGGGVGGRANALSLIVGKNAPAAAPDAQKRNLNLTVNVGGQGAGASNGGAVSVDNSGQIATTGDHAPGIAAQSIGGGGGRGGNGLLGTGEILPVPVEVAFDVPGVGSVPFMRNLKVTVGGAAGSSGNGSQVTVDNSERITTQGDGSIGIMAQSIGGGGGVGGNAGAGALGKLGVGGTGGAAGDGGDVVVNNLGSASIETHGNAASGIVAQSIGGGGGMAGNVTRALTNDVSIGGVNIPKLDVGGGVGIGLGGGGGGDGGFVSVDSTGSIVTHGVVGIGISAQSIGGGGGMLGTLGNETITEPIEDWIDPDEVTGEFQQSVRGFFGSVGDPGSGGKVDVRHTGSITTNAVFAHGIFAQSAGGQGSSDTVDVTIDGQIRANGTDAHGVVVYSKGMAGNGSMSVVVESDSVVQGGTGEGTGVLFRHGNTNVLTNRGTVHTRGGTSATAVYGGDGNETISNFGTITGSVHLGDGNNVLNNRVDGTLNAGSSLYVGATNSFDNAGSFAPGGMGTVSTTTVTGSFQQGPSGTMHVDLDYAANSGSGAADNVAVTESASLDGTLRVTVLDPTQAVAGMHEVTVLNATGGVTLQSLDLDAPTSAIATFEILYPNPNDVVLSWVIDYSPPGLAASQSSFGEYLNEVLADGVPPELQPLVDELVGIQDPADVGAAVDQLIGDVHGALPSLGFQQVTNIHQVLSSQVAQFQSQVPTSGHFVGHRLSSPRSAPGVRLASWGDDRGSSDLVVRGKAPAASWESWVLGYGLNGDIQASGAVAGSAYNSAGTLIGLQRGLDDDTLVGAYGGYSRMTSLATGAAQSATSIGGQAGVFLRRASGGHYLLVTGTFGYDDYETTRVVALGGLGGLAEASFGGYQVSAYVERGAEFNRNGIMLKPMVALQYARLHQDGFTETGVGPLNLSVNAIDTDSLRGMLGGAMGFQHEFNSGWKVAPELRASLMYEMLSGANLVSSGLVGAGSTATFQTPGLDLGRHWAVLGATLSASPTDTIQCFASYDLQLNRRQQTHLASAGAIVVF